MIFYKCAFIKMVIKTKLELNCKFNKKKKFTNLTLMGTRKNSPCTDRKMKLNFENFYVKYERYEYERYLNFLVSPMRLNIKLCFERRKTNFECNLISVLFIFLYKNVWNPYIEFIYIIDIFIGDIYDNISTYYL